jgi:CHAT domain/Kelch motif/Galactose oxidase, central domain
MNSDIELEIGAGSRPGDYQVRVVRSAAGGEPVGLLQLDLDDVLGLRDQLEATVLATAVSARRALPVAEQLLQQVGRQLFEALFAGPVYGTYRASLGVAQQRGRRLRMVLRLTAPELAALPWEALFDPETGTYVCRQEPLVRHVPAPYTPDPLAVRPPLRILGLIASPRGLPALDVSAEKQHLAEALAEPVAAGLVELVWVPEASWEAVHARLLAGEWHVLHFVGHGDYDTRTDEGVLALVGAGGRADLIEAGRLADLLGEAQPTPRLVVLNSCSSGETGAHDLFSGTAAVLVRSGISAVAAMQFAVSDAAAIAFARGFYTALARGRAVDEAARSGRISILGVPRTLEWITPVLYVRGEATHLFTVSAPDGEIQRDPLPSESTGRRRAELRALYVEARAEMRLHHFDTAVGLLDDLLILDSEYPGAADLRATARRQLQLAETYRRAGEAEDESDWTTATRRYAEILQIDAAYRDAATRKEACEAQQRLADLQAELRYHAAEGQWQAVLDVDTELMRIDRSAADPDGLATRARDALLAAVRRTAELDRRYDEARSAEDASDWIGAADGYDEVVRADSAYRDAASRRDTCRDRAMEELRSKLDGYASAGEWQKVLATVGELTRLDPAAADLPSYTELSARARRELDADADRRRVIPPPIDASPPPPDPAAQGGPEAIPRPPAGAQPKLTPDPAPVSKPEPPPPPPWLRRLGYGGTAAACITVLAAVLIWRPWSQSESPATPSASPSPSSSPSPPSPSGGPAKKWETFARLPAPVEGAGAASFHDLLWVAGGNSDDPGHPPVATVHLFNPATGKWSSGPNLLHPVGEASLVSTGGSLYVIGGNSNPTTPLATVYRLDDPHGRWVSDTPLPQARMSGAAAYDGGRILYAGGIGRDGKDHGDIFAFQNGAWQTLPRPLHQPRDNFAAASDGLGSVWFLGGSNPNKTNRYRTVELVQGEEVAKLTDLSAGVRAPAAVWWPGAGACLLGGEGNPAGLVSCVGRPVGAWNPPQLSQPRGGLAAAVVGDYCYTVGGYLRRASASDITEKIPIR